VVPKEFKTSKEEDVAVGPQGRGYVQAWQFGVFHPTEVAHRVFPSPPIARVFSRQYYFSLVYGVVCVGLDRIRIRR
jgi:hypothetical protein